MLMKFESRMDIDIFIKLELYIIFHRTIWLLTRNGSPSEREMIKRSSFFLFLFLFHTCFLPPQGSSISWFLVLSLSSPTRNQGNLLSFTVLSFHGFFPLLLTFIFGTRSDFLKLILELYSIQLMSDSLVFHLDPCFQW